MDSEISARILIVDDDEELTEAASMRLSAAGYDCVIATGAEDGFARFQRGDIDLVITDLIMPVSDGFHLAEWIRQVSDIPIIVLTGYDQAMAPFGHDFPEIKCLSKPYNSDELLALVQAELTARDEQAVK